MVGNPRGELSATRRNRLPLLGIRVTRQALEQRLTPETPEMLKQSLGAAITEVLEMTTPPEALALLETFNGVFVQDSTSITLPDAHHEIWHGHPKKNHRKKARTETSPSL